MPLATSRNRLMRAWKFHICASCAIYRPRMPGSRRCTPIWLWCITPCRGCRQPKALAPSRKVELAHVMMNDHGLSERRACQAIQLARSVLRYRPVARDDGAIIDAIQAYLAANPRHGSGLLYDSFRLQSQPWGKTVLRRVYQQLDLNLLRRARNGCARASSNP